MQKIAILIFLVLTVTILVSFTGSGDEMITLRKIYSRPPAEWPAPFLDEGIPRKELGILPASPISDKQDSLRHLIHLGKLLFFDTRLSGSGTIACASCHSPELSWTDGKEKSTGHGGAFTKRNSPTIQNVWFYERLFWDGRSKSLEDQAFAPINAESEMNGDMPGLSRKLRLVKGYPALFDSAFGDPGINPDRITRALAAFQRTVVGRQSRFDEFLGGRKMILSGSELRGLHLFRTKARCMNCHNGSLFSDNQFHNNGFAGSDNGYFFVTHLEPDKGKFKTPSLRDVNFTGPWMHDGKEKSLENVIDRYDRADMPGPRSSLIRPLYLTNGEKKDLLAFLKAISAAPLPFERPATVY